MALASTSSVQGAHHSTRRPMGVPTTKHSVPTASACSASSCSLVRIGECTSQPSTVAPHVCRRLRPGRPLHALPPSMQPPNPANSSSSSSRFTDEYVNRLLELKSMAHPSTWGQIRATMSQQDAADLDQLIADMEHVSGAWERAETPEQHDSNDSMGLPSNSKTAPAWQSAIRARGPQPSRRDSELQASTSSRARQASSVHTTHEQQLPSDFYSYLRSFVFVGTSDEEVEQCLDTMGRDTIARIAKLYEDLIAFEQTPVPEDQLKIKYDELSRRMEAMTQEVLMQATEDDENPDSVPISATATHQRQTLADTRQQAHRDSAHSSSSSRSSRPWGAGWGTGSEVRKTRGSPQPAPVAETAAQERRPAEQPQAQQQQLHQAWQQQVAAVDSQPSSSSNGGGGSSSVATGLANGSSRTNRAGSSSYASSHSGGGGGRAAARPMVASQARAAAPTPRHYRRPTPSAPNATAAVAVTAAGTARTVGEAGRWLVRRPVSISALNAWTWPAPELHPLAHQDRAPGQWPADIVRGPSPHNSPQQHQLGQQCPQAAVPVGEGIVQSQPEQQHSRPPAVAEAVNDVSTSQRTGKRGRPRTAPRTAAAAASVTDQPLPATPTATPARRSRKASSKVPVATVNTLEDQSQESSR